MMMSWEQIIWWKTSLQFLNLKKFYKILDLIFKKYFEKRTGCFKNEKKIFYKNIANFFRKIMLHYYYTLNP